MGPINPWFVDDLGGYPILGRTHLSMAIQKNGWPEMVFNKKSTDFVDGFGFSGLKMETLSWRWINIICTRKSSNGRDSSNILQTPGEPVQKVFQNVVFALQWYALFVAETRYNTVPCLHPMMKLIRPKRWQPWSTLCVFSPIPTIPVPAGRSCCEYCWGNQWILIMT